MIKEYKIITNVYGHQQNVATIICDACHKEFDVPEGEADQGRKYCNNVCNYKGRGFKTVVKRSR